MNEMRKKLARISEPIAVVKKGDPPLLSEEEISELFPDAIRFMASLKIVAQAQYDKVRKGV